MTDSSNVSYSVSLAQNDRSELKRYGTSAGRSTASQIDWNSQRCVASQECCQSIYLPHASALAKDAVMQALHDETTQTGSNHPGRDTSQLVLTVQY